MLTNSISGLELRGSTYYLRVRVPKAYSDVEPKREINRSLKTRDRKVAETQCVLAKQALRQHWDALRAGRDTGQRCIFEASTELLKGWGMTFRSTEELAKGTVDEILTRLDKLTADTVNTVAAPALLGAVDLPDYPLDEMAKRMPVLQKSDIRAKNDRQKA